MLSFEKIKPAIFLFMGNRDAARQSLQQTYRCPDEQAEKLVKALEEELPLLHLGPRKIARYVSGALTILGFIVAGVGIVGYFSYSTPEMEWAHVPCTVKTLDTRSDGAISVTFEYTYNERTYSINDISRFWQPLGLQKGQRLDMLVNPENPEDTRLPLAKPILQKSTMNMIVVGIVMLVFSIVLWLFTRSA